MIWLRKIRWLWGLSKPVKDPDPIRAALNDGRCPDCGCEKFLFGPEGCGSRNIECEGCGSNFNIFPEGKPIIFAERIGWNRSGRWESRGVLKKIETGRA